MKLKVLLALAVLLASALPALADEVASEAKVSNRDPKIDDVTFPGEDDDPSLAGVQIVPPPGEIRKVKIRVDTSDDNGHQDISKVNATLRSRDNSSIVVGPIPLPREGGNGRSGTYKSTLDIPYWLPAGKYKVETNADDKPGKRMKKWTEIEVVETIAIGLGSSAVGFGSFGPGDTTPPASVDVRNLGNVAIDIEVAGTNLVSSEATIPVSKVKASLSSSMANMMALGLAPTPLTGFDLSPGEGAARKVWFSLHVPTGDEQYVPQATYRGSITLSAVVDR